MVRRTRHGLALLTAGALTHQPPAREPLPYNDPRLPVDVRLKDLLARMTLEEKFWQLYMTTGGPDVSSGLPAGASGKASDYSRGVFGLQIPTVPRGPDGVPATMPPEGAARRHAGRVNAIQRFFVEETRLGVPIIPFDEALHGLVQPGSTTFPQAIGLAATWDPRLVSRVADDVRWGRVEDTQSSSSEQPCDPPEEAAASWTLSRNSGQLIVRAHTIPAAGLG